MILVVEVDGVSVSGLSRGRSLLIVSVMRMWRRRRLFGVGVAMRCPCY